MDNMEIKSPIAVALAAVQAKLRAVREDETNPYFRSRYASLADIWDAIRPILAEQQLSVVQQPGYAEGRVTVRTLLLHPAVDNPFDCGIVSMAPPTARDDDDTPSAQGPGARSTRDNAQTVGARIAYGRRYGLCAALGITTDEHDDDGETAVGRQPSYTDVRRVVARKPVPVARAGESGRAPPPMPVNQPRSAPVIVNQDMEQIHEIMAQAMAPLTNGAAPAQPQSARTTEAIFGATAEQLAEMQRLYPHGTNQPWAEFEKRNGPFNTRQAEQYIRVWSVKK